MKSFLKIFVALFLFSNNALAGAWTQSAGDILFIENVIFYKSDTFTDVNGNKQSQSKFSKTEYNPYIEYGLTNQITLGFTGYVNHISQDKDASNSFSRNENYSIADPSFFARFALMEDGFDPFQLSIQSLVKFRIKNFIDGAPLSGTPSTDFELGLLAGKDFNFLGGTFVDSKIFYRTRRGSGNLNDQYGFEATAGFPFLFNSTLMPFVSGTFANADKQEYVQDFLSAGDFDLVKGQLSTIFDVSDDVSLQIGYFRHLYMRGTSDGDGTLVSLWTRF